MIGVVVAVLVVGAVVVLGMGGGAKTDTTTTEARPTTPTVPTSVGGATGNEGTKAASLIEVEGGSFNFEPNEIRVKAGEPVTIKLNSVDMMHDFVIDELEVRTEIIKGGESTTVTFTPTEKGEYEFYCSVGNHKAQGMVGALIVE